MSEEKSVSLYDLVSTYNSIGQLIAQAGGEITPEIDAMLVKVETGIPAKIDAYHFVMDRLEADENYWKTKAKEFNKIAAAHGNARERMKDAIRLAMQTLGVNELVGIDSKFTMTKNQGALEIDKAALDPAYTMTVTKTTQEPDKERINAAIKDGFTVAGVTFKPTIRPVVNKKELK